MILSLICFIYLFEERYESIQAISTTVKPIGGIRTHNDEQYLSLSNVETSVVASPGWGRLGNQMSTLATLLAF